MNTVPSEGKPGEMARVQMSGKMKSCDEATLRP